MPAIKSLEDLRRVREEALQKRKARETSGRIQIIVGMGTCGIAAGARETMRAILDVIESEDLSDIIVKQTGCIGLCEWEPIVEVIVDNQPKVTYGKVDANAARRIMKEHVIGGQVVQELLVPGQ
ncbi:MAG: (2Fe-2S) ferredoxin domain-containing protein [Anaerolineae bacterium]|nr:(2Fe-2S) ferredoxin domain-containing protein [Anaerolineae bacterium]